MAKLWLIRARRRFSINGLFVRLVVEFVVLVSKVFPAGDVAVDDDGDGGAVAEFAEFVLFVVEFEFWSVFLNISLEKDGGDKKERQRKMCKKKNSFEKLRHKFIFFCLFQNTSVQVIIFNDEHIGHE